VSTAIAEIGVIPTWRFANGDICNIRDVVQCINGVSAVVALAALGAMPPADLDPRDALTTKSSSERCC